jgi:hypothetical protein
MHDKKAASQIAFQMLHMLLITGDESAATVVIQHHVSALQPLSEEQFLAELYAVMMAYHTLLSSLDVAAAAKHPEFLGLRKLITQVTKERAASR